MSLVNCPHCGKSISAGALTCPHCGADPKAPLVEPRLPCRVCGTSLTVSAHRVVGSYGITSQLPTTVSVVGSTATVHEGATIHQRLVTVYHWPCPQCGEPKPLRRVIDIAIFDFLWKFSLTIAFTIFQLCYLFGWFIASIQPRTGHVGPDNIRYLVGITVWVAVTLAMVRGGVMPYGRQTRNAAYHR